MYQAPPSAVSQLAGLGTAGLGALGMYNQATGSKHGGLQEVKKMASGGSALPMKSYSDPQLQNVIKSPASSMMADIYAQSLLKDRAYLKSNPMAANLINQQQMPQGLPQGMPLGMPQTPPMPSPDQMAMAPQTRMGLDNIGTGEMTQMAGGGLLAFADGDVVPENDGTQPIDVSSFFNKSGQVDVNKFLASELSKPKRTVTESIAPDVKEMKEMMQQRKKDAVNQSLVRAGLGMMATKSPYALTGIGEGAQKGMEYYAGEGEGRQKDMKDLLDLRLKAEEKDVARDDKMIGLALNLAVNQENAKLRADQLKYNNAYLQNDKEQKNAQLAIAQFEKNRDNFIKEQTKIAQANMTDIDPLKLNADAYRHAYNTVSKSPIGKYLTTYAPPDTYDVESGYKPAPGSNVVAPGTPPKPGAAPPPVSAADYRYDPNKGTLNPTTVKPAFPTF
jgi:hypothetical protein